MSGQSIVTLEKLPVLGRGRFTVDQDRPADVALAEFVRFCLEQTAVKPQFWENVEILAECVEPTTLESLWAVLQPQLKDIPKETPPEFQGTSNLSRKKREERVEWQHAEVAQRRQ